MSKRTSCPEDRTAKRTAASSEGQAGAPQSLGQSQQPAPDIPVLLVPAPLQLPKRRAETKRADLRECWCTKCFNEGPALIPRTTWNDHQLTMASNAESRKRKRPWMDSLKDSLCNPELVIFKTDTCTVISDKYPKARHHFLVMPTDLEAPKSLTKLDKTHLKLLEEMQSAGEEAVKRVKDSENKVDSFRIGFHAIPSMMHLHLHVISQDFASPSLKNKKHWNSFTTPYFVDSKEVIQLLTDTGEVKYDKTKYGIYLKQDLACHKCSVRPSNIPKLKAHLLTHL